MASADPVDEAQQIALDRAFHVAVATVLDNAVVTRLVGELFDLRITPYFERLACYFENPDSWRAAVAEHRAVVAGLAAHDGAAAGEAIRTHLRLSRDRFSRSFGELPPDKKDRRVAGGNGRPAEAGRKSSRHEPTTGGNR